MIYVVPKHQSNWPCQSGRCKGGGQRCGPAAIIPPRSAGHPSRAGRLQGLGGGGGGSNIKERGEGVVGGEQVPVRRQGRAIVEEWEG